MKKEETAKEMVDIWVNIKHYAPLKFFVESKNSNIFYEVFNVCKGNR